MTYRAVDTAMWSDPFVEGLSPRAKLLFIYLWTNSACSQCGIYVISRGRIEFETGLGLDPELIGELRPKIEFYPDDNVVWVRNFFRRQCQNPKFVIGAIKCLAQINPKYHAEWIGYNSDILSKHNLNLSGYGIHTVSIPNGNGMEKVCLSEQNRTEQEIKDQAKKPPDGLQKCNQKPKSRNFEQRIESKFLDLILEKCETFLKLPQNGTRFNPYQFVQFFTNESRHPQAIIDGLDGLIKFWGSTKNPWAYGQKIVKTNSGNYMERQHIQETEQFKGVWCENPEILKLIRSIGN